MARLTQRIHDADSLLRSCSSRLPVPEGMAAQADRRQLEAFLEELGGPPHSLSNGPFVETQEALHEAALLLLGKLLGKMSEALPKAFRKALAPSPRVVVVVAAKNAQRGWFDRSSETIVLAWRPLRWTSTHLVSVLAHELFHAIQRRIHQGKRLPREAAEGTAVLFELWACEALLGDFAPGIDVALRLRASGHAEGCGSGPAAAVYFRGAAAALRRVRSLEALLLYPGPAAANAVAWAAFLPEHPALEALERHFGEAPEAAGEPSHPLGAEAGAGAARPAPRSNSAGGWDARRGSGGPRRGGRAPALGSRALAGEK